MRIGLTRFYECLLLFLFSSLCALLVNALSPKGIGLVGEWNTDKGVISAVSKSDPVVHDIEIDTVQVAKEIYDSGQAVFVDARPAEDFDDGHIQGSISLPIGEFDERIEGFFETCPPSTRIVTYCSGRECQDSHELAQRLLEIGYSDVTVFIDGFPVWKENGFPIGETEARGSE